MSDIQRWSHEHPTECIPVRYGEGDWIRYADHVAALRACEARVTERHNAEHEDDRLAAFQNGYDAATVKERQRSALLIADAYGKGLSAARDAVVALLGKTVPPSDGVTEALAAIDALGVSDG